VPLGSRFAAPGIYIISERESKTPDPVNTAEKPTLPEFSACWFVFAFLLGSQTPNTSIRYTLWLTAFLHCSPATIATQMPLFPNNFARSPLW